MNPLVSIVITNFNYGHYIKDAIDSALNQTYQNIEVIVVDDGSKDNSRSVISSYGDKIKPVFKDNFGQASAFNVGFKISKGEIIAFLDADDVLLSTAIKQAVEKFKTQHIVKVSWPLFAVNKKLEKLGNIIPSVPLSKGDLKKSMIEYGPDSYISPPTSGNAWSRNFIEQIFPMPEKDYKLEPDYYLVMQAPFFGEIESILECQGLYRIHGQNTVSKITYTWHLNMLNHYMSSLSKYLFKLGYNFDVNRWKNSYYLQIEKMEKVEKKLSKLIPKGSSYILIDMNEWGQGSLVEHGQCYPFLEKNGIYWGSPETDVVAISEFERMRSYGIDFCVFGWPAFWWFEFYPQFYKYLNNNFDCTFKDDQLVVFNLNTESK